MSASKTAGAHATRRCSARTRQGTPCRIAVLAGSEPPHCFTHAPDRASDRAHARKRGGEATRAPHLFDLTAHPANLRDVGSIQALLERIVHETLAQANGHERSRALGALLTIALKALETGEMEARLAELEEQVTQRRVRRMAS